MAPVLAQSASIILEKQNSSSYYYLSSTSVSPESVLAKNLNLLSRGMIAFVSCEVRM